MATAAEYVAKIGADISGLEKGLGDARQKLAGLGAGVPTSGIDNFVGRATSSFNSLGATITGIGPLTAGMAVVAAAGIGVLAKHAFDAAVAFDDASDKIRVATGAVGAELTALEGSFKTIFTSIPTSAEDAAQAVSFLSARLHLSDEALEELAKTELELARITGSALAPQLEATTRLFKDWEVATDAQTTSLDFLFKVGQKTAVGVTDLSQKLVQFGAPLRAMGFSFEEAAVLIGKFQAEGVELTKVLPGLRIALSKMAKEGITDASEAFSRLIERIQSAQTPLEAVGLAAKVFGQRAGSDMAEAIRQGRFSIDELMKTVEASQSTIIQTGKDVNDFSEKWIILKNKASEALEPLGRLVFDALGLVTGAFSDNEAEIKKGWEKFWNDLGGQAKVGVHNLADAIMQADKSPFFQAGEAFGEAFKSGIEKAFDSIVKSLFSIEGPQIISNPLGAAREKINWGAEQTKWGGEGFKVGQHLGKGVKAGHDSAVYKSPYFAFDAMDKALDKMFGLADKGKKVGAAIGSGMSAGLKEFLELSARATEFILKEVVQDMEALVVVFKGIPQPVIEIVDVFEEMAAATKKAADAARDLIPAEKELEITVESAAAAVGNVEPYVRAAGAAQVLQSQFEQLSQSLPRAWNTIIDGLVKGGSELSVKVKGYAKDILDVFDNLPGKWGQSLNRALGEVNRWVGFIDSSLRLLHRIFSSIPEGLEAALSKLGGLFKSTKPILEGFGSDWLKAGQAGKTAATTISTSWIKAGDGVKVGASAAAGALASLTTAMSVTAATGSKTAGIISSLFTSTLAGIQAGMAFGPVGGAIVGGISLIGGIFGALFGGGKSAAQKQQEALQLEKLKTDVAKDAQAIFSSALDSVKKALELAPGIAEFEGVGKEQIKKVFKFMTRLVNQFIEMAKVWNAENLNKAKQVAEAIGPVFQAVTLIPQAEQAINSSFGVSDAQIDRAFDTLDKIVDRWSARAEQWGAVQFKKIEKIANRLAPAINLFSPLVQAVVDTNNIQEPSDAQLGIVERSLDKIITMVGGIAEKFEKPFLKALQNLAEKVGPAQQLWKDQVDLMKATFEVTPLRESDADSVVSGMRLFIDKLIAGFATFNTEGLGRILVVVQAITPVAAALKAWAESANAIRDYTVIAAEVWDAIASDFARGLVFLNLLILDAKIAVEKGKELKAYIDEFASTVAGALSTYTSTISSAASALSAGLPQGGAPLPSGTASAASSLGSSFGALGPSFRGGAPAATTVPQAAASHTTNNFTIVQEAPPPSALESESNWREWQRRWWQERRARALGMGIQIPVYLTE